jgi:gamma-glutamylcyclotransferase (GGCT)/AIG2-like uncharacterized protein YtfP
MLPTNNHLFVYGTLRPGFDNQAARLLHQSADYLGPARVRGKLYEIADYPGLVHCANAEDSWVHGDVYVLHSPAQTYDVLDKYEGNEYCRSVLSIELSASGWIEACVYVYTADIGGKQRIASGNYLVR